jgi:hypothetical protein
LLQIRKWLLRVLKMTKIVNKRGYATLIRHFLDEHTEN